MWNRLSSLEDKTHTMSIALWPSTASFSKRERSDLMLAMFHGSLPEGREPIAIEAGLPILAPKLLRLERYERRAFSRRNTAMRELAALKRR